ncbi:MAG TPA: M10 family metallopeptidase C-terminal domain-containing protein [Microvirga sp.]|jgi:serralysin
MAGVASVEPTGDPTLDALLGGVRWDASALTYSFPTSGAFYGASYGVGEAENGFEPLLAAQQSAVRAVLQTFAEVANLAFAEIPETLTQHADLRFARSLEPGTAWAYYPHPAPEGGDVWFGHGRTWYDAPRLGNYAYATILHEIGHALGLKHAHEVDGAFGAMPFAQDSTEYTVMSYRSYAGASTTSGYPNETWGFAQSLMMHDIRALQHMYGANYATRPGDTVYAWNPWTGEMSVDGIGRGAPGANRVFSTVWDGGGSDTYDFSAYGTALAVDLRPGAWSVTDPLQRARLNAGGTERAAGTVANALLPEGDERSLIENAIGGGAADSLTGNDAANRLVGGAGGDQLQGLGGADTLDGGDGSDAALYAGAAADYSWVVLPDGSVRVTDGRGGSPEGIDLLRSVEVLVFSDKAVSLAGAPVSWTPVEPGRIPQAPSAILVEGGTVQELAPSGTVAARLAALDEDPGETFTYQLLDDAGGRLVLVGDAILVADGLRLDHEQAASLSVRVRATDSAGLFVDQTITLAVANTDPEIAVGRAAADTFIGGAGRDAFRGLGGVDRLQGGAGNDRLAGGAGADILTGGTGRDVFVFDTKATRGSADTIRDYRAVDDAIHLDNAVFKVGRGSPDRPLALAPHLFRAGPVAEDANDRIVYNRATGALFYDADGTGAAAAIKIAQFKAGLGLGAGEFLVI